MIPLQFTQLTYNDGKDNEINDEDIDDPDDQFSDDNTTGKLNFMHYKLFL